MRRTNLVSNDVVESRHQNRLRALHRKRLMTATAVIRDSAPPRFAHLEQTTKAASKEKVDRDRTITHDNNLLVEKMVHILGRKPKPNHDPVLLTKAAHATVEDAYRPGPIPLPKSLNKEARTRQLENIVLENRNFLNRLIASPGVYNKKQWDRQFGNEVKYMNSICKFPYQDPSYTMPQVNPILAIAQAQSDKTAEIILKQQQKILGTTFGANGTTLPLWTGTGTLPPLTANTAAIVPQSPSATGTIPNHFPMPPQFNSTTSTYPSPPSTARPGTSSSAAAAKLRAQYTTQGVRVIRTARTHQGARPGTSQASLIDSWKPSRTPKYQPLRTQTPGVAAAGHDKKPEEQKEHAAAGDASAPATAPAASPAGSASSTVISPPSTAAAGASSAQKDSDVAVPPPATQPSKLFEDTLIISNRPVLLRIFECGAPWRMEIQCFDPYSKLEYNLSLPFSYIRLCFYQVPDLLLASNRPYLVQTLLHYLVFAPSESDPSSLELLVDIVAPPPRNDSESQAWQLAQDELLIEQAKYELDREKEHLQAKQQQMEQELSDESKQFEAEHAKAHAEFERLKSNPEHAHQQLLEAAADGSLTLPPSGLSQAPSQASLSAAATPSQASTANLPAVASSTASSTSVAATPAPAPAPAATAPAASVGQEDEFVIHRKGEQAPPSDGTFPVVASTQPATALTAAAPSSAPVASDVPAAASSSPTEATAAPAPAAAEAEAPAPVISITPPAHSPNTSEVPAAAAAAAAAAAPASSQPAPAADAAAAPVADTSASTPAPAAVAVAVAAAPDASAASAAPAAVAVPAEASAAAPPATSPGESDEM